MLRYAAELDHELRGKLGHKLSTGSSSTSPPCCSVTLSSGLAPSRHPANQRLLVFGNPLGLISSLACAYAVTRGIYGGVYMRRVGTALALAAGAVLAVANTAAAATTLTQISFDPFQNTTAIDGVIVNHATEVEPDTFSSGSTIVSAFQVGRFFNGGSDDIGFATSTNGGSSFKHGLLPGLTFHVDTNSPYERVSDASVAFDAKHNVWMVSSIPLLPNNLVVPTVLISRSTDGGRTWNDPVSTPAPSGPVDLDKNWTVCDNSSSSPFFGHCYTEVDNFAQFDLELLTTSTDGGLTWSTPIPTPNHAHGLGGQPLVQPGGTVVVPFESIDGLGSIASFGSTDGGVTLTPSVTISPINFHRVAGNLRTSPLPSAEIDGAGKVFVAWEDCAFEVGCPANDIIFSTSTDGQTWSPIHLVPIDGGKGSGADHFIPGLAVDKSTPIPSQGIGTHLGLTYYFYPNANCGTSSTAPCQLEAGFISSIDGGAHWGGQQTLTPRSMSLSWIASTSQGFMVGDYISTSFSGGVAFPVIADASSGTGPDNLNEAMFTTSTGLIATGGSLPATAQGATAGVAPISFVVGPTNR